MLTKRIIPCLDVKEGRVVKGVNFVNLIDAGDPVEAAKAYDKAGADELVFLDITASHEERGIMIDVVQRTAASCFMPLTVGGGLRTVEDIDAMLRAGADKISLNTSAIATPDLVTAGSKRFGAQCIVVAIDARRRGQFEEAEAAGLETQNSAEAPSDACGDPTEAAAGWEVYTHGGRRPTGLDAIEWARRVEALGAGEILLTSMDCDGTKAGYDLELTAAVADAVSIPVIASGGVGTLEHLYDGLTQGKADAVLAASIFHFGTYTIGEAKRYLAERGLPIRPVPETVPSAA